MKREPSQQNPSSTAPSSAPERGSAKRTYEKPSLVAYGRVEDMTRGGGNSKTEAGGKPLKGT